MYETPFYVDEKSFKEAYSLTEELSLEHLERVGNQYRLESFVDFYSGRVPSGDATGFSRPLEKIGREIPLEDVAEDVQEFGALSSLAEEFDLKLPMVTLDQELRPLPLLPAKGSPIYSYLQPFISSPTQMKLAFEEVMQSRAEEGIYSMESPNTVRDTFFSGLHEFLSVRIAGFRWVKRAGGSAGASLAAGGGGGISSGGARSFIGSTQKWEVHTLGCGYSLYYSGTHACRSGATYLNAPTTPVDVYLPLGTIYLAANAGSGGKYVWDKSVITVPSQTPTFYTKEF